MALRQWKEAYNKKICTPVPWRQTVYSKVESPLAYCHHQTKSKLYFCCLMCCVLWKTYMSRNTYMPLGAIWYRFRDNTQYRHNTSLSPVICNYIAIKCRNSGNSQWMRYGLLDKPASNQSVRHCAVLTASQRPQNYSCLRNLRKTPNIEASSHELCQNRAIYCVAAFQCIGRCARKPPV